MRTALGYTSSMTAQIAVKLPDDVLARVDELVREGSYESRSQVVRRGIDLVLAVERRSEVDRAYQQGYGRFPETKEELRDTERLAIESIREEPWERWW